MAIALPVAIGGHQVVPAPGVTLTDAQLFDDSVLQRLDLQISTRDWDTLRANYQLNTYYPATLVWQGQTVRNIGIRSRGSGTRNGRKPGLLLDFNRYVRDQRFLGLEALVLDNHLQDPSAMREALAMTLHARLGLPAPREALAEVFVNGEFFGVYTLVEDLDAVSMKRIFGRAAAAPLQQMMLPRDPALPIRLPPRAPAPPTPTPPTPPGPQPDIPTGYLYEYNWLDYFWGSYPGPDLALYEELLEAKTREDESKESLYRPIEMLFREINETPNSEFRARVGALLDLPLCIRTAAVQAYLAEWDGVFGAFGMNNFYLYRPADGGAHRIVPWDEDSTFHAVDYPIDADHDRHILIRSAMRVPELRQLFFESLEQIMRLTEAREAGGGETWFEREIRRRGALMGARMREDRVKPFTDEEVDRAIAFNIEFARRRGEAVRQQVQQLQQLGAMQRRR